MYYNFYLRLFAFLKSKYLYFLILGCVISCQTLVAQTPYISWQKSLGGDSLDYAYDIQQTTDGGYVLAGASASINGDVTGNHGNGDYWIVKLDSMGDIDWQKCLGGSDSDGATAIQQTSDGGYIVAGSSNSLDGDVTGNHGDDDYWIVKLAANGDIDWQKSLGGNQQEKAYAIQQTTDGGYIVAGWSLSINGDVIGNHGNEDYWIIKLDSSGTLSWQKCFGGSDDEQARSIQQTIDGGYIVAGYSYSNDGDVTGNHGNNDSWVIKLDLNGNLVWQKCLGGSDSDGASSVQQTVDGGYIVGGTTYSHDGNVTANQGLSDYWIVKLTATGALSWQKSFGGSNWDDATSIQQTTDGGYIVAGLSMSNDGDVTGNHGSWDYWIVKLKPNGTLAWQQSLGGSCNEWAFSIQQTTDGGYIVAGFSNSIDGDVTENYGSGDFWIVKLGTYGVGTEEDSSAGSLSIWNKEISLYPNPAQNILNIDNNATKDIVILNMLGERLMAMRVVGKEGIDVSGLPSGVYWVRDIDSGRGEMFVKE